MGTRPRLKKMDLRARIKKREKGGWRIIITGTSIFSLNYVESEAYEDALVKMRASLTEIRRQTEHRLKREALQNANLHNYFE